MCCASHLISFLIIWRCRYANRNGMFSIYSSDKWEMNMTKKRRRKKLLVCVCACFVLSENIHIFCQSLRHTFARKPERISSDRPNSTTFSAEKNVDALQKYPKDKWFVVILSHFYFGMVLLVLLVLLPLPVYINENIVSSKIVKKM